MPIEYLNPLCDDPFCKRGTQVEPDNVSDVLHLFALSVQEMLSHIFQGSHTTTKPSSDKHSAKYLDWDALNKTADSKVRMHVFRGLPVPQEKASDPQRTDITEPDVGLYLGSTRLLSGD